MAKGYDAHLRKEQKEMISDLTRVFEPMSNKITKPLVKMVYNNCFNIVLKQKPYIREAMSLAKVLATQQLEKLITSKEETVIEEALKVAAEREQAEDLESPITKTKFVD